MNFDNYIIENNATVRQTAKQFGISKSTVQTDLTEQLGTELADMLHYIVAITAINEINLTGIILEKDKAASIKYHHDINLEMFLMSREHM